MYVCAVCVLYVPCVRVYVCVGGCFACYTACRESRGLSRDTTTSSHAHGTCFAFTIAHTHKTWSTQPTNARSLCISPKNECCSWIFTLLTHSRSTRSRQIRRIPERSRINSTSSTTQAHACVRVCLCGVHTHAQCTCVCSLSAAKNQIAHEHAGIPCHMIWSSPRRVRCSLWQLHSKYQHV